jgi:hypothetical protein
MSGDASDEEAAWRELVAQYSAPAATDGGAPWPVREELSGTRQASSRAPGVTGAGEQAGPDSREQAGPDSREQAGPDDREQAGPDSREQAGPDAGEQAPPGGAQKSPQEWTDPIPGVIPAPPHVRPAVPAPLPPAGDDEHYVPPVPPPLPRLDPVSRGAWAALFGGPAYLLLAVLLGWVVPSWAGFCAVAAFVGGFATLVVRMGDRPPNDSGPDDGAVV